MLPKCFAYVYCSWYTDHFNSNECIAVTTRYDFTNPFKINIPLSAASNKKYFWVYLKATHPSNLMIDNLMMDSHVLEPVVVAGKTEQGFYVSEEKDSMIYLGKISDISTGSMLSIDACASPADSQKG